MFDTFRRSWELTKASLAVLRADKELLLFPFVSFIALVVVTLSFAIPWLLVGGLTEVESRGPGVTLIGAAASGIFTASLYRYATKGDAGPAFRPETMSAAFRTKGGLASRFGQSR